MALTVNDAKQESAIADSSNVAKDPVGKSPIEPNQQGKMIKAGQVDQPESVEMGFEPSVMNGSRSSASIDSVPDFPATEGPEQQRQIQQQQVKKQEKTQTFQEDIERIIQINQNAQERGGAFSQAIGFGVDTAAEGMEKMANRGIELRNDVARIFGSDNPWEKIDLISRNIEKSDTRETFRYIGQTLAWTAGIAGTAAALGVGSSAVATVGTGVLAAASAEYIFNEDEDLLSQQALMEMPFGNEVLDFLEDPFGDGETAERMEKAIYGVADAGIASAFIKSLRFIKPVWRTAKGKWQKLIDPQRVIGEAELGETTITRGAGTTGTTETASTADEMLMPPVPDEAVKESIQTNLQRKAIKESQTRTVRPSDAEEVFLPPTPEEVKQVSQSMNFSQGRKNKLLMQEDGKRVYQNVMRFNTNEDIRNAITSTIEANPGLYKKKKYDFDEIKQIADGMNLTPSKVQDMAQANNLELGQLLAARRVQAEAASSLVEYNKQFSAGEIGVAEFARVYDNYRRTSKAVSDMSSLSSAILREGAIPVETSAARRMQMEDIDRITVEAQELVDRYGTDGIQRVSKALGDLTYEMERKYGKEMAEDMVDSVLEKSTKLGPSRAEEFLQHMRYGGMLSDPYTQIRNIVLGLEAIGMRNAETWTAATINGMTRNGVSKAQGMSFKEAMAESLGFFQGSLEAISIVSKRLALYSDDKLNTNLEKLTGKPPEFLGVRPGFDKIPDYITDIDKPESLAGSIMMEIVKTPNRMLKVGDNGVKHISARMTLNREVHAAYAADIRNGMPAEKALQKLNAAKANPDENLLAKMFSEGEEATMTKEVEGRYLRSLNQLTNPEKGPVNKLLSWIAPFARSHINSFQHRLERVPGLNMTLSSYRRQMNHTNPRVRQRAMAKATTTTALLAPTAAYLHLNNRLTGPIPRDGRYHIYDAQGLMPNSIIMPNGKAIEYPRQSAMGGILYAMSRLAQIGDVIDNGNDDMYGEIGSAVAASVWSLYNVDYLADSLPDLVKAIESNDEGKVADLVKVGGSIATQYLPFAGVSRRANRIFNEEGDTKRDIKAGTGELADIMDALYNEVMNIYAPGGLAPKRDILGRPVPHKEGLGALVVTPFNIRNLDNNPVMKELGRLADVQHLYSDEDFVASLDGQNVYSSDRLDISMPSRTFTPPSSKGSEVSPIRLNNNQYERLVLMSAGIDEDIPENLTLENSLKKVFDSKWYKEAPKAMQVQVARKVIMEYRSIGKKLYLQKEVGIESLKNYVKGMERNLKKRYFID